MTETRPDNLETKANVPGYVPAPTPFDNGMSDGLTPGTTNTPGKYVAPGSEEDTAGASESEDTPGSGDTAGASESGDATKSDSSTGAKSAKSGAKAATKAS